MTEPDDAVVPVSSPGQTVWFGGTGAPVVIVLHDGFGRLDHVLEFCAALQPHGFRVAAPDLYGGVATTDPEAAERLTSSLALEPALSLIDECIASAGGSRVGVVGFAIGGRLALAHAQTGAADAAVAYYATLGADTAAVLPCPVMLHLAEGDEWDEGAEPDAFVARLRDHGTPVARHEYVGTVHGFANAAVPEQREPRAAALAFARTAGFLQRELID